MGKKKKIYFKNLILKIQDKDFYSPLQRKKKKQIKTFFIFNYKLQKKQQLERI